MSAGKPTIHIRPDKLFFHSPSQANEPERRGRDSPVLGVVRYLPPTPHHGALALYWSRNGIHDRRSDTTAPARRPITALRRTPSTNQRSADGTRPGDKYIIGKR